MYWRPNPYRTARSSSPSTITTITSLKYKRFGHHPPYPTAIESLSALSFSCIIPVDEYEDRHTTKNIF